MSLQCGSGDTFTDYDGSLQFAECHDVAEFKWGPESGEVRWDSDGKWQLVGADWSLFCDRHMIDALQQEVADNAPEDMMDSPVEILNLCDKPDCTHDALFVHTTSTGKRYRYCDEHSVEHLYWASIHTIASIDAYEPLVMI